MFNKSNVFVSGMVLPQKREISPISSNYLDQVLFFVITIRSSSRAPFVYSKWVPELENITKREQVYYISTDGCYSEKLRCVSPPDRIAKLLNSKNWGSSSQNVDRAAKRVSAADFLMSHRQFEWVVVITDDVMVNIHRIHDMISDLWRIGDPKTTPIFKGHCVELSHCLNKSCIQGGSGHIMSYEAARRFVEIGDNWIQTCDYADDDHISVAIKDMGMSLNDVASPYFVGLNIYAHQYYHLIKREYFKMPKCNDKYHLQHCNYGNQPLNKLIFVHMDSWSRTEEAYPYLFGNYPDNVQWYQTVDPNICYSN